MGAYLLVWLVCVLGVFGQGDYSLTPLAPPSAFLGQYYTLRFRVTGLDSPTFTFTGLPGCFISTGNGTIEGTPNATGSFVLRVSFSSGAVQSYSDVVLRVVAA